MWEIRYEKMVVWNPSHVPSGALKSSFYQSTTAITKGPVFGESLRILRIN